MAVLAITPLVVPALMGFRAAVGGLARFDAGLANALLGTATRPVVPRKNVRLEETRAGAVDRQESERSLT